MRFLALSLFLVGCASADPGFGPASPTHSQAPVAELPVVAGALEHDPAPAPGATSDDMGHHGHAGHSMGEEPSTASGDDELSGAHRGHTGE